MVMSTKSKLIIAIDIDDVIAASTESLRLAVNERHNAALTPEHYEIDADSSFREQVYSIVSQIPNGRVMTYGQIAALCGRPRAARMVGGIAHQAPCANLPACGTGPQPADLTAFRTDFTSVGSLHRSTSTARSATRQESARSAIRLSPGNLCPAHNIPWHRVVKKDGSLAEGYPGGTQGHRAALEAEGVIFTVNGKLADMSKRLWQRL